METLVLERPGSMRLESRAPTAAPGPGEARVRTRCVGVCGTDIRAYFGRQPFFS